MKKIIIYTFLLFWTTAIYAQKTKEHTYYIESKFKGMNLVMKGEKVFATVYEKPTPFFIWFAEINCIDEGNNEFVLQLEDDKLVIKRPPTMTNEKRAEYNLSRRSNEPVEKWLHLLPSLKSRWQFEPAGDGYVYIRCVYDPYPGFLLTVTHSQDEKIFEIGLSPQKPSLNDDQKWKLIRIN